MLNKNNYTYLTVTVKVESFSAVYINRFLLIAQKALNTNFSCITRPVSLPKKIERFTLLKSPHIYKKAREQFERVTYKRAFSFCVLDSFENQNSLYSLLQLFGNFSQGVNIQYQYKTHHSQNNDNI